MPYYPPSGGGGSFDPHSPGPIGDVTPDTIAGTTLNLSGAISTDNGLLTTDGSGNITMEQINAETSVSVNNGSQQLNSDGSFNLAGGFFTSDSGGNLQSIGNLVLDQDVTMGGLPTSDPNVFGELWTNLGIVTQSQG